MSYDDVQEGLDLLSSRWSAQPKQTEFLAAKTDECFFGGAAGGGKSDALLLWNIIRRMKYPFSRGLFLRRTIKQLKKQGSAIPRSHELLTGIATWNGDTNSWKFPNGSVLEFGYCENENDVYQYQSAQYDDICFDELTHFTKFQYDYMKSRCRSVRGVPTAIRAAGNPGNVGHAWVKKYFVRAEKEDGTIAEPGEVVKTKIKNIVTGKIVERTKVFIASFVWDNQILMENDPGYVLFLQQLPADERRALLEGDWDVFKGQFFPEWRNELHVVRDFEIPQHWTRYLCMDWGYSAPSAVYWIAVDPTQHAWVYRELYTTGLIGSEMGERIKQMSMQDFPEVPPSEVMRHYRGFPCDPSIFAKKGEGTDSTGNIIQKELRRPLMPANNQRVNGWQCMRQWLSLDKKKQTPWLQFFSSCENAIRTIPELIYANTEEKKAVKARVEDCDTTGEDHAGDSIRYWAVTFPKGAIKKEPEIPADLPMRDAARLDREIQAKKNAKTKGVQDFMSQLS